MTCQTGFGILASNNMKSLNDNDLIHFGKHKGICLGCVPAGYLFWYYTACQKDGTSKLKLTEYMTERDKRFILIYQYIHKNRNKILQRYRKEQDELKSSYTYFDPIDCMMMDDFH